MRSEKRSKIAFIHTYPFDTAPGQRFRYEQYLTFIEKEYDVSLFPFLSNELWAIYYAEHQKFKKMYLMLLCFVKRFFLIFRLLPYQKVFIYREAAPLGPPFFEWIIAKVLRKKYVYDFDDAIWLPNYSESNAKFHRLKAYWKVRYCMKWAHQVTAGNEYLASYARQFNPNVMVIPTTIDTVNHHNIMSSHDLPEIVIGWTGTHTTMHYLDELIPVLEQLEKKYKFTFLVISNQAPGYQLKSLKFIKWNKATEIEDLAKMHIGVMPLKQDIWSEGKCGFKGLQYMALEIPTVMSPVGVNSTIVQHGINGFLPDSVQEWKETLELLLQNPELRKQIGKEGRKRIEENYSVNANVGKYLGLFD